MVTASPCQLVGLCKSLPSTCQQQSSLNYKRRVYTAHGKDTLESSAWVTGYAVPQDPTGTSYIRPRYQDRESLLLYLIHRNKHREADRIKKQRNMAQMKEQIKTPEKQLNKRKINKLSDAEFKTVVIRMLGELSEDLNSIKQIQTEMKDTLIEIKNNLQGKNSRVDEAKNKINDLEHKEQKRTNQNNKKKESKKTRIAEGASETTSSFPTFSS